MPATRTFYLIRQVGNQIRVLIDRGLAQFDITPAQYTLLNVLAARESMTSAMLARALQVSPQTMNTLISALQKQGFIARSKDAKNKRILLIALTDQGRETTAACNRIVDRLEDEFFGHLGATELVSFRYTLEGLLARPRRVRNAR